MHLCCGAGPLDGLVTLELLQWALGGPTLLGALARLNHTWRDLLRANREATQGTRETARESAKSKRATEEG